MGGKPRTRPRSAAGKAGKASNETALLPVLPLGPQVLLSPLSIDDVPELEQLIERNRSRLRQWLPWVEQTHGTAGAFAFVRTAEHERKSGVALRLGLRYHKRLVGVVALQQINHRHHTASIGYWLDRSAEGQGLVTAAVAEMCRFGLEGLGLVRIELAAAVDNRKSRAVAERLGFRLEGILRCRERVLDRYVDHAVYSITLLDPPPPTIELGNHSSSGSSSRMTSPAARSSSSRGTTALTRATSGKP